MSTILSFPTLRTKRAENLRFSFSTFGPSQTNCFTDFHRCVKAAMDVQIPFHEGDDMYIFEGTTRKIVCIITFQGVEYTDSGRQFLRERGIDAA
jgi:hypothetical protein